MRALGRVLGVAIGVSFLLVLSAIAVGQVGAAGANARTGPSSPSYNATFNETGLPAGTNWSVHVAYIGCACAGVHRTVTSNVSSIAIPLPNGSYRYNILPVPGFFVSGIARGTFNVSGAPLPTIFVAFVPIVTYSAEFLETGLPSGTVWSVHVAGNGQGQEWSMEHVTLNSTGTSMNFTLPNGTYRYDVMRVPGSFFNGSSRGTFSVSGGSPNVTTVRFVTPAQYSVTFVETGLPAGTNWSVRVNGWGGVPVHEAQSSTTSTITFLLPNGTYRYVVSEILGFVVNGSSFGHFYVSGAPVPFPVAFRALGSGAFYSVTFEENGLASGTHWVVGLSATRGFGPGGKTEQSSNGTTVKFLLQNGTYRFRILPVHGYLSNVSIGRFSVVGASPPLMVVNFTAIPTYSVTFTESGLPAGTNWSVLVATQAEGWSVWPVHVLVTSNTTAIAFNLPNGSYCYRIYPVAGWHVTSGAVRGSITVSGASPPEISVVFSASS